MLLNFTYKENYKKRRYKIKKSYYLYRKITNHKPMAYKEQ